MVKLKSHADYLYDLSNGFAIAIEIGAIFKLLEIVRLAVLESKIYWIDLIILGFLFVTCLVEAMLVEILFVDKRVNLNLPKKQKWIIGLVIFFYIIFILFLFYSFLSIFQLVKLT